MLKRMHAVYSQHSHKNAKSTSCAKWHTKKSLETFPILFYQSFKNCSTHIEYWTGKNRNKRNYDKRSLLIYFLQLLIIASKLIAHHCYRKTNYCVYCLDEFWFSDGSLSDKAKFNDPGLMPLPDTATGLDWSHLVDAARAFEGNRKIWIKINVQYTSIFYKYLLYNHIFNYKNPVFASVAL